MPADEQGRGKTVFVPFVLEHERVEAKLVEQRPGFARAKLEAILEAAPHRIPPGCPYFQTCGGCHYQHTGYKHQLEIKAAILQENLRRIAKLESDQKLTIHPSPEWNYRNRARLKIHSTPQFALGYYEFGSHKLLPIQQCPISSPLINRTIAALWKLGSAGEIDSAIQEVELFATADDSELMIEAYCSLSVNTANAEAWAQKLQSALPEVSCVAIFQSRPQERVDARRSALKPSEPELVASSGSTTLSYKTTNAQYRVSAGAFFQTNRFLTDELVRIVTSEKRGSTALDLYAGVGLFSSVLNREFERVIAVESSPTSYADLVYNSPANVKAIRATTEQYLNNVSGKLQPDCVVVDPPRSGLGEKVVDALVRLNSKHVTYVSCDPATLARDLRGLINSGYRIEHAHLIDLFPQTYHIESVFHLIR
ncbi:MAG: rRNA (uracil1939-C5)-methyltransferase [Acidobacteriaceae bacterium]|jgi:23S rRNA (uracil1939-C5)-methyltransferase